jgi:hypothetical protein
MAAEPLRSEFLRSLTGFVAPPRDVDPGQVDKAPPTPASLWSAQEVGSARILFRLAAAPRWMTLC